MQGVARALAAAVGVVLLVLVGFPAALGAVAEAPGESAPVYVYVGHHHNSAPTSVAVDRGPPSTIYADIAHTADGPRPRGASTRPDTVAGSDHTTYDEPTHSAQVTVVRTTTTAAAVPVSGISALSEPARVAANSGNRVFWSGGQPAKEAAEAFAKADGSKTLEMTAVGRTLEKLPYNRFTAKLWDASSAGFAATARGNANVFIGPSFRGAGSTFGRIEGPILRFKGNPILQRFEDVW